MAPQPNHRREDVIAAGLSLRARKKEPTQNELWIALGRTGHPTTVWKYWQEFLGTQNAAALTAAVAPSATPLSPDRARAHQGIAAAVEGLVDQVRREAEVPLIAQLQAVTAALVAAQEKVADLNILTDCQHEDNTALQEETRSLREENGRLLAQLARLTAPKSSLILRP